MNKTELVAAISNKTDYTEASVKEILDAFMEITMNQVAKNDAVRLAGFGTFAKHRRAARNVWGIDGKLHKKKATAIPYFTVGEVFKRKVRKSK